MPAGRVVRARGEMRQNLDTWDEVLGAHLMGRGPVTSSAGHCSESRLGLFMVLGVGDRKGTVQRTVFRNQAR